MQTAAKKISQREQIMGYMRLYGTITPAEAQRLCGCRRLSARIDEIKKQVSR